MDTRRDEAPAPDEAHGADAFALGDAAVFAMERVPRARGLKPVAFVVLAIAGLAVGGALARGQQTEQAVALANAAPATGVPSPGPDTPLQALSGGRNWGAFKNGDDRALPPPLLSLDAQATGGLVFVHGDVFTRGALYVVVRIADAANGTLDIRALNMPGGSTAFRTGPNDRFSIAFRLIDPLSKQPAWVSADAYDHNGAIIATARAAIGSS
ncbi:MAG TPA: hypothetical protein VHR16_11735 [Candidatus Limnocylindrales bacterium]|jgi:hypothetical protein|nr:hypothetical protein [Candidatus Limnocylindrales bacterium]